MGFAGALRRRDQLKSYIMENDGKVMRCVNVETTTWSKPSRRLLTEGAVRASDRRAQFVGIDAYQAAGGDVMRDLFQQDDGGWLGDGYSTQG
jgi:hypothetical protein